jgi:hypothetical protein
VYCPAFYEDFSNNNKSRVFARTFITCTALKGIYMNLKQKLFFGIVAIIILAIIPAFIKIQSSTDHENKTEKLAASSSDAVAEPISTSKKQEAGTEIPRFAEKGIPVLMYHSISSRPGNSLIVNSESIYRGNGMAPQAKLSHDFN